MTDQIGIDTLILYAEDYEVQRKNNLTVQPSAIKPSGELTADFPLWSGVSGSKAYCNDEICQVTLSAKEDRAVKMFVQCSVPKVAQGKNYYMVGRDQTIDAINKVQSHLTDIGIRTNLQSARLTRVDTCRNNFLAAPVKNYIFTLENAYAKRMEKIDYGVTGLLFTNTQQQICIYDKNELLRVENQLTKGLPTNNLRIETRLVKGAKVKSATGLQVVSDLLSADGFHTVQQNYLKTLRANVFSFKPVRVDADKSGELRQRAEYMKRMYGRNFEMYLSAIDGTPRIIEQYGLENYLNTILDVADLSPQARKVRKARMRRQIKERQRHFEYLGGQVYDGRSASDLYIELREMALRKVA